MNLVPGMFYSFNKSIVSSSVTPSYIKNFFSAYPTSAFLDPEYISTKYVLLENTCEYWLPSNYFTLPSMVYLSHMHVSILVWNTLSVLYFLDRRINAQRLSLYIVLYIASHACLVPIYHRPLSSSGDTLELRPFDWNRLACGTSCIITFDSDKLIDGIETTLKLQIIILVMTPIS